MLVDVFQMSECTYNIFIQSYCVIDLPKDLGSTLPKLISQTEQKRQKGYFESNWFVIVISQTEQKRVDCSK